MSATNRLDWCGWTVVCMHGQQLNQIANGREGFARPNDNGNHGQGVDTWPFIGEVQGKKIYI